MEIEVLKNEKNEMEIELNDLTIAEILRIYLQKDNVALYKNRVQL